MPAPHQGKVVFMRRAPQGHLVDVKAISGPIPPLPEKESRLRCACGSTHFFVTRIDFVCVVCNRSYCD